MSGESRGYPVACSIVGTLRMLQGHRVAAFLFCIANMRAARARVRSQPPVDGEPAVAAARAAVLCNDPAVAALGSAQTRRWAIAKWASAKWDSKELTEMGYYHTIAGGEGMKDLQVDPKSMGGNHARKVRTALRIGPMFEQEMFNIPVPLYDKTTCGRVEVEFPIRDPIKALRKMMQRRPADYNVLKIDPDNWQVPSFVDHPLTKRWGISAVLPVGFYTDKVKHSLSDTFYRCSFGVTFVRLENRRTTTGFGCSRVFEAAC